MTATAIEPSLHRSAWLATDMRATDDWILHLSDDDNEELARAVAKARRERIGIPALDPAHFTLPRLGPRLDALLDELIDGRGFALVRGLDLGRLGVEDAALAFWGLGAHLGAGRAQNAQGDLLGHVTDLGLDYCRDATVRGYQTRQVLPFHNDSLDLVALLCLRQARSGGRSRIVSSTAIHDTLLATRPDLVRVGYRPFYQDRRGEAAEGTLPYLAGPLFARAGGRLFCRYNRTYYESAQRFPEVPRLSTPQIELMDAIDALCNDPVHCLEMDLLPGDMQFLCNYTTLHSRTAYEDWPQLDRRRYLLRLWLDTGRYAELPDAIAERHRDMLRWQADPKPPVFDLSRVRAELAH